MQQNVFLFDGIGSFHNSRKADGEDRPAAQLAFDRNVATHHLTEASCSADTHANQRLLGVKVAQQKFALRSVLISSPVCAVRGV